MSLRKVRTIASFQKYRKWMFLEYEDINDTLNLASVSCQISLADIYDKVDFTSTES